MSIRQPDTEVAYANPAARVPETGRTWRRRVVLFAPLLVFVGIGIFLAIGLTLDPRTVPSVLIGAPVPEFSLPAVRGRALGLSSADLMGDPYTRTGADIDGRVAIDWGVYGVPETFVVGRDGRIAFKLVGPITPDNLERALKPAIEKALAQPAGEK
jgi:cytochrome c biogenesis protein CcmG/thiol:disulfide interchange protein DsbE